MITPMQFIREHILEMKQSELAEELNVKQPAIAMWEREGASVPWYRKPQIIELAAAKGKRVEMEWFDQLPLLPEVQQ